MREVNESTLTLTVCAVKGNGTLTIGDEDTEVLSLLTATCKLSVRTSF